MSKRTTQHLHEKRGITFAELGALLGTRAMLASGVIKHRKVQDLAHRAIAGAHDFNMGCACNYAECGTLSCIGGTMALIMGLDAGDATRYVGSGLRKGSHSPSLRDLFFPPDGRDWQKATSRIAISAIDKWLKTGNPGWSKLLPQR